MKTVTSRYFSPRALLTSSKGPLIVNLVFLLLLVSTPTLTWAEEVKVATVSTAVPPPESSTPTSIVLPEVIKNISSEVPTSAPPAAPVPQQNSSDAGPPVPTAAPPAQVSNGPSEVPSPPEPTNSTETTEKASEATTSQTEFSDPNATTIFVTPFPPESTTETPSTTTLAPLDPKASADPQTPTWSVVLMVMLAVASLILTAMFLIRRHYARKRKEERRFLLSEGYFFGENNQL